MLNKGANPNIKAHDELDPLMSAVENGDKETVILLLEKGANVKTRTRLTTPVYIAQEKGHSDMANLLLDRGAPENPGFCWQLRRSAIKRWSNLLCRWIFPWFGHLGLLFGYQGHPQSNRKATVAM